MATTLEGFAVECRTFSTVVLSKATFKATGKAALAAKKTFLAAYAAAGYAKGFTNAKGNRTGIPISYTVFEAPGGARAVISAKGNIPRIIESGSYKHPDGYWIDPKKRGKKKAIKVGGNFYAHVHHPPQKPHPVFHTAAQTLNRTTVPVFAAEIASGMAGVFR